MAMNTTPQEAHPSLSGLTPQEAHPSLSGLISDTDFVTIDYALGYVMFIISLAGVVTNSLNIRTFTFMGLRDGVSISLLGLSISDLGFTAFGCILSSSLIIRAVEMRYEIKTLPMHPSVITMFSANISFIFFQVTCMTTTFLAVVRCMCVAMPFRFKDTFTSSRCVFALGVFTLIASATYLPVLSQMGIQSKFDNNVNKTRIVLWMSSKRTETKIIVSTINTVVFVFISTFVVMACILIMAKYLRQSVKFRNNMSSGTTTGGDEVKEKSNDKLSGKELHVVRQVILICAIYTACMFPSIPFITLRMIDEDFDVGKRLNNLYFITSSIGVLLNLVNSATTFPVYYVYNSKFRSLCFSTKKSQSNRESLSSQ